MKHKLMEMLTQLLHLNENLLKMLIDERDHLVSNDMAGLGIVNVQQLEISENIKKVELERIQLVKEMREDLKISNEPATLDDVIAHASEAEGRLFIEKRDALKAVLAKIMRYRELNNRLIKKMLVFNDKNIRLLIDLGNTQLTYNNSGDMVESRKQLLDSIV